MASKEGDQDADRGPGFKKPKDPEMLVDWTEAKTEPWDAEAPATAAPKKSGEGPGDRGKTPPAKPAPTNAPIKPAGPAKGEKPQPAKKAPEPVTPLNAGAEASEVSQAKQAHAQQRVFQVVQPTGKPPSESPPASITLDPRPVQGVPGEERPPAPTPPPAAAPPTPPPVAQWKNLEPEDKTDPVPHELYDFRDDLDGTWNMVAGSIRGRLHAHKGLYREDAYAFAMVNGWKIIVVCDGAGTSKHARVASRLASAAAAESLKKSLSDYRIIENTAGGIANETVVHLREVLTKAALDARTIVEREQVQRRAQTRDVYTTLLIMIHAPFKDGGLVGVFQIGDGAIGVLTDDDSCHVLGIADHGQYSSETRFLTDAGIINSFPDRVKFRLFVRPIRAIAVMCDGVSDDFFPEDKRLIELFVGDPIQELKMKIGDKSEPAWGIMHKERGILHDPRNGKALIDWLRYEKRGSSDDRTLVLLYRSPSP